MINHYLNLWQLSEPELLAQTATSDVYVVKSGETKVVLKLIKPFGVEERTGAVALRYFGGHGAVKLLNEDEHAHLLEYADGDDLTGFVRNGEDEKATAIIADVLKQLHSVNHQPYPASLTPLTVWFRELFRQAEKSPDAIYARAAIRADALLKNPREVRVLHGDIHHENIRSCEGRGWLAFDPKGLVGERTYDAANTLCNPVNMPEVVHDQDRLLRNAEILARKMEVELSRLLDFVYVYSALSAAWFLSDDLDPLQPLKVAELVEPLLK